MIRVLCVCNTEYEPLPSLTLSLFYSFFVCVGGVEMESIVNNDSFVLLIVKINQKVIFLPKNMYYQ